MAAVFVVPLSNKSGKRLVTFIVMVVVIIGGVIAERKKQLDKMTAMIL